MELGTPPKYGTEASALTAHHAAVDVHVFGDRNVSGQRRSNFLLLLFRALSFFFSLAAVVVMGTNKHDVRGTLSKVAWYDYDPYRYVVAVNGIICVYSFLESWLAVWTFVRGSLVLPETFQVWFDFGHDQGFAYLLFSASSVGVAMAQLLQTGAVSILDSYDCSDAKAFCNQAKVAISLGFGAFFFLALSSCITGLRVARWWLS
ncbi:unnamed protein product [Sphagnum troendelagicum]|uniref:CASP-like protein n=2 Tax=Sphagnum TaxID=13804 RepID=A0ABP0U6Y8_9BRYO|nr:hypothetical protein BDL97_02G006300 [Sphagnum fallax]KAH8968894.1 hypothetical protein BDL97_02G006300 [Sphagnum fallax]KAH8968895.1 hypothetical protein BDL97_02G006300 [Sphagnum fallax]KAH8968896.1 hypothetical protein BDL97_02G006300 [Sphagnum fallax]